MDVGLALMSNERSATNAHEGQRRERSERVRQPVMRDGFAGAGASRTRARKDVIGLGFAGSVFLRA
ncbi:MAG: hypothetical protein DCC49_02900 [Acidobacteria bacterium]|nr:MAG: hypothetical protein DCC49_02900 [Acidobacteriota bacterium]